MSLNVSPAGRRWREYSPLNKGSENTRFAREAALSAEMPGCLKPVGGFTKTVTKFQLRREAPCPIDEEQGMPRQLFWSNLAGRENGESPSNSQAISNRRD